MDERSPEDRLVLELAKVTEFRVMTFTFVLIC
jgi:hypothetical protein